MIKCNINRAKDRVQVKASGTTADCMVETAMAIQQIYRGLKSQNPEAADNYRRHIIGIIIDPDSPVWKE